MTRHWEMIRPFLQRESRHWQPRGKERVERGKQRERGRKKERERERERETERMRERERER